MERLKEKLDKLAERVKVPKLSGFYNYSELEREYAETGESEDETEELSLERPRVKGEWFDAKPGLLAIQTLRQHLLEHFEDLGFEPDRSTAHWPAQLMDELKHSESILEQAVKQKQPFRFLIVP